MLSSRGGGELNYLRFFKNFKWTIY